MDLLSFLAKTLDLVVDLSRLLAVMVVVFVTRAIAKRMPTRLQNALSVVTRIIVVATFWSETMLQHLAFITIKTSLIIGIISAVTAIIIAFALLLATYQTSLSFRRFCRLRVKLKDSVVKMIVYMRKQLSFSFHLKYSPVMLQ